MNELLAGLMLDEFANQSLPRSEEREDMKCPVCQKFGLTSKVYPQGALTTQVWSPPFYDEEGRFHHHDQNTITREFNCSRNHNWTEEWQNPCWCENQKVVKQVIIKQLKWRVVGELHLGGKTTSTLDTKEAAEYTASRWREEDVDDGGFRYNSVVVSSSWDPEPDFNSKEYKELFGEQQHG